MLRLVDLDQVVEVEHPPRKRPVPEQIVERRQQHGRGRAAAGRASVPAGNEHRRAAVGDRDAARAARRQRGRRRRAGSCRRRPSAASARRRRPRSAHRARARPSAQAPAAARARTGSGASSTAVGSTRSGQVVEALESLPAGDRRDRRGSRAGRASPSPASSSTSRPRSRLRNGATRAGRARGSRRGSRPRDADASRRRRRTSGGLRRASGRRRAASPRPAAGTPRGPSTRTPVLRRAAARRFRRGTRRRGTTSAIRWLRSTAEIESSWTQERRRIVASTSRVEPVRDARRVSLGCDHDPAQRGERDVSHRRIQPQRGTVAPWTSEPAAQEARPRADRAAERAAGRVAGRAGAVRIPARGAVQLEVRGRPRRRRSPTSSRCSRRSLGTILLIAPSAYHRLRWREKNKERMLRTSNRFAIAGLVVDRGGDDGLGLPRHRRAAAATAAALVTSAAGACFALAWFALPLSTPYDRWDDDDLDDERAVGTARYDGVRPSRIVASRAASMLPPETMHTIRPSPARPDERRSDGERSRALGDDAGPLGEQPHGARRSRRASAAMRAREQRPGALPHRAEQPLAARAVDERRRVVDLDRLAGREGRRRAAPPSRARRRTRASRGSSARARSRSRSSGRRRPRARARCRSRRDPRRARGRSCRCPAITASSMHGVDEVALDARDRRPPPSPATSARTAP